MSYDIIAAMNVTRLLIPAYALTLLSAICFYPTEGHVSQVFAETVTLQQVIPTTRHVVEATSLNKGELFKRVVFPASTSPMGKETVYEEGVELYRVNKALHSDSIASGQIIRVWTRPNYGEYLVQFEHEGHGSKSISVEKYSPLRAPQRGKPTILLLGETVSALSTAYTYLGAEDPASAADIMKAMAAAPASPVSDPHDPTLPNIPPPVPPTHQ